MAVLWSAMGQPYETAVEGAGFGVVAKPPLRPRSERQRHKQDGQWSVAEVRTARRQRVCDVCAQIVHVVARPVVSAELGGWALGGREGGGGGW